MSALLTIAYITVGIIVATVFCVVIDGEDFGDILVSAAIGMAWPIPLTIAVLIAPFAIGAIVVTRWRKR